MLVTHGLPDPILLSVEDIHPAYLKWGDFVPGLIGFKPNTDAFDEALHFINGDVMHADLTKYAGGPYIMMLLGDLGKEQSSYTEVVPTTRSTRGSRFDRKVLTNKARELSNTIVEPIYRAAVEDKGFTQELAQYFKADNIIEARERILEGFKTQI